MVRSMIAGVAGLKAHQQKMDVIGNNIANVNTWGFKGFSYNFTDAMYTNSIKSTGGSVEAGASGGRNASQVGYGSQLSSISNVFENGAPSPSANPMDCMIDGTGFFLVGKMVNGSFTDVKSSGLYLSRVGIFRVDDNKYLVDDQRNYVYGYAVKEGTGIPEIPSTSASTKMEGVPIKFDKATIDGKETDVIEIAGEQVPIPASYVNETDPRKAVEEWVDKAAKRDLFKDVTIEYKGMSTRNTGTADAPDNKSLPIIIITANSTGTDTDKVVSDVIAEFGGTDGDKGYKETVTLGQDYVAGIPAEYEEELSTLRIPVDTSGQRYKLDNYSINEDGIISGVDENNRVIIIGKVALVQVQNPNGLEKTTGYYYQIGDNAGEVNAVEPNTGPAGFIKPSYLEMANVDLANEFSNIITTQRGFQANSKIITVTDEMLQELVNMKR